MPDQSGLLLFFGVRCHRSTSTGHKVGALSLTVGPVQAQEVSTLLTQNAALLQRVSELEAQNDHLLGSDMIPLSVLECQICNLVSSSTLLSHGPDSPEQLEGFTLDTLMCEVKSLAPDLLCLFNTGGNKEKCRR